MSRCRRVAFAALTISLTTSLVPAQSPTKQVAITIDDLPLGGDGSPCDFQSVRRMTARLLEPFIAQRVPLTGFVNEGRCRDMTPRELHAALDMWLRAGADLGNHTYSHADLSHTPVAQYKDEITRGDTVTRAALAGRGDHEVVERVTQAYVPYLESVVAFFEGRAREVAGHAFPQILLLHANRLNAEAMSAVLRMLRARGYEFVTLDQALQDEAYRLPDLYAGPGGFSWIHRWSITKQMKPRGEPDEPAFIDEQYRKLQQRR